MKIQIGDMPLSARAIQALEFAADEAQRLGQKAITPEHLLLGLIRQQQPWPKRIRSYERARKIMGRLFDLDWWAENDFVPLTEQEAREMKATRQAKLSARSADWAHAEKFVAGRLSRWLRKLIKTIRRNP